MRSSANSTLSTFQHLKVEAIVKSLNYFSCSSTGFEGADLQVDDETVFEARSGDYRYREGHKSSDVALKMNNRQEGIPGPDESQKSMPLTPPHLLVLYLNVGASLSQSGTRTNPERKRRKPSEAIHK